MKVLSIDHLVLTVLDIERTCLFYETILGMERVAFGEGRTALHFGRQKINLHQSDSPVDLNVKHATCGSADLCFIVNIGIEEVFDHLTGLGVRVIQGPCERTGASGPIRSVYIYDPDENLIELSSYS